MADFCKDCSEDMFGEDTRDLATGLPNAPRLRQQLCEGCGGYILVNKDGKKVAGPKQVGETWTEEELSRDADMPNDKI